MSLLTNKLYLTRPHTSENIGDPCLLELKGSAVSIEIFGSKDETNTITELTPQGEIIEEEGSYPLFALPRYVVFVGTADKINVEGYDLTEIKDIS